MKAGEPVALWARIGAGAIAALCVSSLVALVIEGFWRDPFFVLVVLPAAAFLALFTPVVFRGTEPTWLRHEFVSYATMGLVGLYMLAFRGELLLQVSPVFLGLVLVLRLMLVELPVWICRRHTRLVLACMVTGYVLAWSAPVWAGGLTGATAPQADLLMLCAIILVLTDALAGPVRNRFLPPLA